MMKHIFTTDCVGHLKTPQVGFPLGLAQLVFENAWANRHFRGEVCSSKCVLTDIKHLAYHHHLKGTTT